MDSNSFLQIRSTKLRVLPGEDDELVNEGMYGKALAEYLQTRLSQRGFQTPMIVCEDWGWWLAIAGLPFSCGLCIYGRRIGDSDDLDLCVTVSTGRGRKWSWGRFRFIDTTAEVERLHHAIRNAFAEDSDITIIGETTDFPLE